MTTTLIENGTSIGVLDPWCMCFVLVLLTLFTLKLKRILKIVLLFLLGSMETGDLTLSTMEGTPHPSLK